MQATFQVSNHSEAGSRIPTNASEQSWETLATGDWIDGQAVRDGVEQLSKFYRHARAMRDGKLYYGVFR